MKRIATLSRFEHAELYRLAHGYGVLPKRIVQCPDHALTLTALKPKGLTSYASLTITGSTQLDVTDALLSACRKAASDDLESVTEKTDEMENTFFSEPPVSIVEPASVTGQLIVPEMLSDAADWTFDVSPMGVWPGRIRIEVAAIFIRDVIEWWESGADGLAFAYDYQLSREDCLSISIGKDSSLTSTHASGLSTALAWEALRGRIARSDPPASPSRILTEISLSSRDRRAALNLLKT
jgi:hypothetical protein